jgi:WhiB family redox-sensing transcriptional regulator
MTKPITDPIRRPSLALRTFFERPELPNAKCATAGDPDLWFEEEKGEPTEAARHACDGCPEIEPCLIWALTHNMDHGVWGGKTPRERHNMRRSRQRKKTAA